MSCAASPLPLSYIQLGNHQPSQSTAQVVRTECFSHTPGSHSLNSTFLSIEMPMLKLPIYYCCSSNFQHPRKTPFRGQSGKVLHLPFQTSHITNTVTSYGTEPGYEANTFYILSVTGVTSFTFHSPTHCISAENEVSTVMHLHHPFTCSGSLIPCLVFDCLP